VFTSPIFFFLCLAALLLFIPRIYRNPRWGVLLLIFLLPFERIPSWDIPWEWGITLRLSHIVALILMITFISQLIKGEISWPKLKKYLSNPVVVSVFIYLLIALLSVIWAVDKEKSLLVAGFTFFTAAAGFLTYFWLDDKKMLPKIEKVLFWAVLVVSIFGIYQFLADTFNFSSFWSGLDDRYLKEVLGFPRVQSVALEPLFLANYLLIPLGIFTALFLTKRSHLSEKRLILAIVLVFATVVLTVSRGGYGAAAILLILITLFLKKEYSFQRFLKLIKVILIGLVLAGGLVFFSSYSVYGNASGALNLLTHSGRLASEKGERLNSREGVWIQAWQGFKERPAIGVGAGNFGPWLETKGFPGRQRIVNNEPLEILVETGVLGAIPIILMVAFVILRFVKSYRQAKDCYLSPFLAGLFAVFGAACFQYLSFSTLYIIHFWVLIGLLLAVEKNIAKEYV